MTWMVLYRQSFPSAGVSLTFELEPDLGETRITLADDQAQVTLEFPEERLRTLLRLWSQQLDRPYDYYSRGMESW